MHAAPARNCACSLGVCTRRTRRDAPVLNTARGMKHTHTLFTKALTVMDLESWVSGFAGNSGPATWAPPASRPPCLTPPALAAVTRALSQEGKRRVDLRRSLRAVHSERFSLALSGIVFARPYRSSFPFPLPGFWRERVFWRTNCAHLPLCRPSPNLQNTCPLAQPGASSPLFYLSKGKTGVSAPRQADYKVTFSDRHRVGAS